MSLILVKTFGGSGARSLSAKTSTNENGSRFFRRMLTTSPAVHEQSAISTNSTGLDAAFSAPASITDECPEDAIPTKRSLSIHFADAVISLIVNCPCLVRDGSARGTGSDQTA